LKSEITSFDIAALVPELNKAIRDARIENIYQLNPKTLLFRLHQPNQPTLQLLLEAGKRAHLTSYVMSKPLTPPAFCMALRKYLRNGRVRSVQQPDFERVLIIQIDTREGMFSLVTELFGDGNIILVNPQGTVFYALAYREMRDRNVLRGASYQPAPQSGKNPFALSRQDFDEVKQFGQLDVVRALTRFLGIGGLYSEEILLRASIDKNVPCEALTQQQIEAIYTETRILVSKITDGKIEPNIVVDEKGEWLDAIPFPLKKYADFNQKPFKSLNEALDEYYSKALTEEKTAKAEIQFTRELARLQRTLEDQQRTLEDSKKIAEQNKLIGDLIYAHFSELQSLAQYAAEAKEKGKTWEQIASEMEKEKKAQHQPLIYFQSLDSKRRILNVTFDNTSFSLDLTQSIPANAAEYYERAKKAGRKLEGAQKAFFDTRRKIDELQKRLKTEAEAVKAEVPQKRKEKAWFEKFRWFRSSDDFLVLGGKDATTNEILVKKHTEPVDIVFHADVAGAPFVIIKTEGKTPPEQTILEAAQVAASYSKAWREMLHAVDVYWVRPDQLSKTPPSGQFLEKGAFIISGKKNYIRAVPLRVAIGITRDENRFSVIGGPVESVKKQSSVYVEVVQGEHASSELVKQIRKLLVEKAVARGRTQMPEISLEDIQCFMPSGKGEVVNQSI
jgi:predicted ribosome quality control (RQC) complex YloA/Tae2 family protein